MFTNCFTSSSNKLNQDRDGVRSSDLLRFYFSIFSSVLVSIEKVYETLKTSKFVKYTPLHVVFSTLPGAWKCGRIRSFVLHI